MGKGSMTKKMRQRKAQLKKKDRLRKLIAASRSGRR